MASFENLLSGIGFGFWHKVVLLNCGHVLGPEVADFYTSSNGMKLSGLS